VILGLIGTWDLLSKAKGQSDRVFWACFVYGLSATTLFTASTLYHSTFLHERARRVFQILDHCAIFILIAGTYTPIGLIGLSNVPEAVAMVIMEWLIALVGITIYCVSAHIPRLVESFPYIIYEVVLYLVMGQMCLFSYEQIIVPLSKDLLFTLLLGGGIYIVGVIFFVLEQVKRIPIMHCVWHIFVLAAAIVHFFSVRSAVVNHLYETAHSEAAIAASKPWLSELAKFPQFRDL
jgi:hemolysin III